MKLLGLVLLYLKILEIVSSDCDEIQPLACAFVEIKKSFKNESRFVTVYNFRQNDEAIEAVLNSKDTEFFYQIKSHRAIPLAEKYGDYCLNESGILLVDSFQTLDNFNQNAKFTNKAPKKHKFYVYGKNLTETEIMRLQDNLPFAVMSMHNNIAKRDFLHFEYFLIEDENLIKLVTLVFFSPGHCRKKKILEINRFNKTTKKWAHGLFSTKKFDNFYGCELNFLTFDNRSILDGHDKLNPGVGFNYEIIEEIAKKLNFKPQIYFNGKLKKQIMDLAVMTVCKPMPNDDLFFEINTHYSEFYMTAADYFFVPLGAEYDGYEKLKFPFDDYTWGMIAFVFFVTFVTIFLVNRMTTKIKDIVFGDNIQGPFLNAMAHFFGLGQIRLPARNFARFILMVFILYCLIIRSVWQSKMFEFLQKEMRKPEVKSCEEIRFRNFTIYIPTFFGMFFEMMENSRCLGSKFFFDKNSELKFGLKFDFYDDFNTSQALKVYNSIYKSSNVSFLSDSLQLYRLAIISRGELLNRILKQDESQITVYSCGMKFSANDKLYDSFNRRIQQLHEAGIIKHIMDKYEKFLDAKFYQKPIMTHKKYLETTWRKSFIDEPKVLTFKDLKFGFVIWFLSMIIPLIIFMFELIIKIFEFAIIQNILKVYFEQKRSESKEKSRCIFFRKIEEFAQENLSQNEKNIEIEARERETRICKPPRHYKMIVNRDTEDEIETIYADQQEQKSDEKLREEFRHIQGRVLKTDKIVKDFFLRYHEECKKSSPNTNMS
jgi:hypothetical protein